MTRIPHIVDLIIPALNEEKAIAKVLDDLPPIFRHVILCDNGSTDRTAQVALQRGATVLYQPRRGYGMACLTGIDYVQKTHPLPDAVAFVDADYSDYPEELELLVRHLFDKKFDLVLGSRTQYPGARAAMGLHQLWGNYLAVSIIEILYGVRYTDLGPMRVIRWKALQQLQMRDTNYGWTVEMQVKAARQGLRIAELPVHYRPRIGQSKVSGTLTGSLRAGYKILSTIFKYALT